MPSSRKPQMFARFVHMTYITTSHTPNIHIISEKRDSQQHKHELYPGWRVSTLSSLLQPRVVQSEIHPLTQRTKDATDAQRVVCCCFRLTRRLRARVTAKLGYSVPGPNIRKAEVVSAVVLWRHDVRVSWLEVFRVCVEMSRSSKCHRGQSGAKTYRHLKCYIYITSNQNLFFRRIHLATLNCRGCVCHMYRALAKWLDFLSFFVSQACRVWFADMVNASTYVYIRLMRNEKTTTAQSKIINTNAVPVIM